MINTARKEAPELVRIVVAIDPATTNTADSDETGIVVVGKDKHGEYYVLEDVSGFYSPNGWASKAINSYTTYRADRVIGEANNGGDMIETIVKNIDKNVSYAKVWASRGKITRAEPISALYEKGKVHHTKEFIDLEYEMTNYTGEGGETSPNRMDALVWAITYLISKQKTNNNLTGIFQ